MPESPKLSFTMQACRIDGHGSTTHCKDAQITLDTDRAGRPPPWTTLRCATPTSSNTGKVVQ